MSTGHSGNHRLPTRYIAGMYWGRRIVAALSAALVLQLVFVGGGYACPGSDARGSMTDMGMATMAHGGQPASTHHRTPCPFPWAPDGCQNMVPCAPAAIAAPTRGVVDLPPIVAPVPVMSVVMPPSVIAPPELPPPRA
jgi:hypothetical protein